MDGIDNLKSNEAQEVRKNLEKEYALYNDNPNATNFELTRKSRDQLYSKTNNTQIFNEGKDNLNNRNFDGFRRNIQQMQEEYMTEQNNQMLTKLEELNQIDKPIITNFRREWLRLHSKNTGEMDQLRANMKDTFTLAKELSDTFGSNIDSLKKNPKLANRVNRTDIDQYLNTIKEQSDYFTNNKEQLNNFFNDLNTGTINRDKFNKYPTYSSLLDNYRKFLNAINFLIEKLTTHGYEFEDSKGHEKGDANGHVIGKFSVASGYDLFKQALEQQAQTHQESEKKQEGLNNPEITDFGFLQSIIPDTTPESFKQDQEVVEKFSKLIMGFKEGKRDSLGQDFLHELDGRDPEGAILLAFRKLTSPENGKVNNIQRQQYLASLLQLFSPEEQLQTIFKVIPQSRNEGLGKNYDITRDTNYHTEKNYNTSFNVFYEKLASVPVDKLYDATSFLYNGDEHIKDILIQTQDITGPDFFKKHLFEMATSFAGKGHFDFLNDKELGDKTPILLRFITDSGFRIPSVKNTVASN